jgi:hypothetical protein
MTETVPVLTARSPVVVRAALPPAPPFAVPIPPVKPRVAWETAKLLEAKETGLPVPEEPWKARVAGPVPLVFKTVTLPVPKRDPSFTWTPVMLAEVPLMLKTWYVFVALIVTGTPLFKTVTPLFKVGRLADKLIKSPAMPDRSTTPPQLSALTVAMAAPRDPALLSPAFVVTVMVTGRQVAAAGTGNEDIPMAQRTLIRIRVSAFDLRW